MKKKWQKAFELGLGTHWGSTEVHIEDVKYFLESLSDETLERIITELKAQSSPS